MFMLIFPPPFPLLCHSAPDFPQLSQNFSFHNKYVKPGETSCENDMKDPLSYEFFLTIIIAAG